MQPLAGVRVVDFSTLLPGPLASLILAEAGAEVVKIERPGGEDMRGFPPKLGEISASFAALNRGKSSVFVDLKSPEAMAVLRPLIEAADVLIEQFRPGVMARMGFGYDDVAAINPRIIYCSITGYGQSGPRAMEAGHDLNYMAATGVLSQSPGTVEAPSLPPALIADIGGGSYPAVINILLALRQRDQTGRGAHLDISMTDGLFTFAWYGLAQGHASGRYPAARENALTGASPRYQLYATRDGRFVACAALEQKFWDAFCAAIHLPPDLRDDRVDPAATRAAVAAAIGREDASFWRENFARADCCAVVMSSLDEALADPHFVARGLFDRSVGDGAGASMPALPVPVAPCFRDVVVSKPAPKAR